MRKRKAAKTSNPTSRPKWITWIASLCGLCSMHHPTQAIEPIPLKTGRHRIEPLCSVPAADYQHGARTPSIVVRSLSAIPQHTADSVEEKITAIKQLASSTKTVPGVEPKFLPFPIVDTKVRSTSKRIQLANNSLEIAHCEISDVALLIEPTGNWHLSLRADQNRVSKVDEQTRNSEIHIKRNAFRIGIRLLESQHGHQEVVGPQVDNQINPIQSSRVSLAHIDVPAFWVQRESPQLLTLKGYDPLIARYYDDISEAEFQFFVVLDPLTGNGKGVVMPWQRNAGMRFK